MKIFATTLISLLLLNSNTKAQSIKDILNGVVKKDSSSGKSILDNVLTTTKKKQVY